VCFAGQHGVSRPSALTPALPEGFCTCRPRPRPRSFNHPLGAAAGLLDWAVAHELLEASPLPAGLGGGRTMTTTQPMGPLLHSYVVGI
jgi:hypothetical protein